MNQKQPDIQEIFESLAKFKYNLDPDLESCIDLIVSRSESQKGVLTVIITGAVYKLLHPEQDVRIHQSNMTGGYSGRTFDTRYITPFLKANNFPAMAESGWLTRSLEQALPYNKDYPGSISGKGLKKSFLQVYDCLQECQNVRAILAAIFQKLIKKRDSEIIILAKPVNLTISQTIELLTYHFKEDYKNTAGASRLPGISIYSAYRTMVENQIGRYQDKRLLELEAHTAADSSTGSIGDIQINDKEETPFEGIEVKARSITPDMVDTVYQKIQSHKNVDRYYILATQEVSDEQTLRRINDKISDIRARHGCEVIVKGVFETLKYFLRLTETDSFIANYAAQLAIDPALKYEHRKAWNDLCSKT